ncbi:MAG: tripartite tricarboxylate transporter substrate-binding protein [Chloroflexi bacterium]|nr:tripartite tricarboxylate transporter substrate-binding protein [Chloroflexota bacterium]
MRTLATLLAVVVVTLLMGLAVGCSQASKSAAPEEFYRGKTLTWVVSAGATGGDETDLLSRAVAPYLAKELGATVKVTNMASDEGLNWVYEQAKRDGLTLVAKSTSAVVAPDIMKAPGILYETEKFNILADIFPAGKVMQISPKLPYKTLDDLRQAKGLKGGGTVAKGSLGLSAAVGLEILGLDGKVITGFKGKKDLTLALARGEIDFMLTNDAGAAKDAADGYAVNLLVVTKDRSVFVPEVPTMYELGVKVPREMESALEFILAAGYMTALPPEVPPERVEFLRGAFQRVGANPELKAELKKITGASSPFLTGKMLQDRMNTMKSNKVLADQLDALFTKYGAVQ